MRLSKDRSIIQYPTGPMSMSPMIQRLNGAKVIHRTECNPIDMNARGHADENDAGENKMENKADRGVLLDLCVWMRSSVSETVNRS